MEKAQNKLWFENPDDFFYTLKFAIKDAFRLSSAVIIFLLTLFTLLPQIQSSKNFSISNSYIKKCNKHFISSSTSPKNENKGGEGGGYSKRNGNAIQFYFYGRNYAGKNLLFSFTTTLPDKYDCMQDVFKNLNHYHGRYPEDVKEDPYLFIVREIAAWIKQKSDENCVSFASLALSFVQSLPYAENMGSYQRHPSEVILDRTGDCSDTSVLFAALLYAQNFDCVFLEYPVHLMVGIWCTDNLPGVYLYKNCKHYYMCETTSADNQIGQCWGAYCKLAAKVIDLY